MKRIITTVIALVIGFTGFSQEDEQEDQGSVIQNLTPSKLIGKGQVDIKWFNNLYTQTRQLDANEEVQDIARENFFTSTLDVFFGVSENKRVSVGAILEFRSNAVGGRGAFDVFSFDGETGTARSGLTNIAPSVKFVPFAKLSNFSVQSSLFISTIGDEVDDAGVFLDQDGFTWQNRFFYDLPLGQNKEWQLFFDLNTEYNFGKNEDSFANDSLRLTPGVFLSYFPSSKFTVLGFVQHFQLIALTDNGFEQDITSIGTGVKYQLTDKLNIEGLFSYFARGNGAFTGLGEAYNIGLRYVL
ncbi:hypothetical protein [Winogradskyella haliclonae]|uniref:Transporter n=1 Tax=Winogradskyella haliclonae TaxID=2048558 RepID=A0ABQ2BVY4_9FLAO|nr:hypothetical protein [Winogradskyella haliclonae]GGI56661.1 hypothetical protein GCM10011444_09700 [Winogradskyella haliclonae]